MRIASPRIQSRPTRNHMSYRGPGSLITESFLQDTMKMIRGLTAAAISTIAVLLLAACGGGVSDEEFDAVQQDMNAEKAKASDLEGRIAKAEATPEPRRPEP